MNEKQELEAVANFMDPNPTRFHKGARKGYWQSKNRWWEWFDCENKWRVIPNPRKHIQTAMEVLVHCTKKLRKDTKNLQAEWKLNEIFGCNGETGEPEIFYICEFNQESNHYGDTAICRFGSGPTPEQAIFEAVVKLIDYLKEQEK